MNVVSLSYKDFNEVYAIFTGFHASYATFFQNNTKSVAKSALDYLHGQLFIKQQQNLWQYCREGKESEYEAMQHFISSSPLDDVKLINQLQKDVLNLLGDANDGALILDESGIPKQSLADGEPAPIEVRTFARNLKESDWTRLEIRETERGWLIADFAAFLVWHSVDNLPFAEVWLLMRRSLGAKGEVRYAFSNAQKDTPLEQLAKMQCRRYWVERALEDAKGEAGLDKYQVRGWRGRHHHMTMTLLAMLFMLQLTIRFRSKAPMLTLLQTTSAISLRIDSQALSRRLSNLSGIGLIAHCQICFDNSPNPVVSSLSGDPVRNLDCI
jgi:SRSO17 transposase